MNSSAKVRNPSMDIIRCFALFCVISVHFFLNSGFYDVPISGICAFFLVLIRNFFMICVPLFMVLSGYLLRKKQVSKQYYLRIIQILTIYVLASVSCALYRITLPPHDFSVAGTVIGILGYYTAPYGWYIGMYIGLFLLIPFLNILYNHIPSKTLKTVFLLSLGFLTAAPSLVNDFFPVFPDYWTSIYPLTYYFIGCYLSEYPLNLKQRTNILLIGLVCIISGSVSYYSSLGSTFQWSAWQGHESTCSMLQTILVFSFLAQRDYSRLGIKSRKFFSHISNCCLGAYLVSWIFDSIFYEILNNYQPIVFHRAVFFIPITLAVYVCSVLLSTILNFIYTLTVGRIMNRLSMQKKTVSP